MTNTKKVGKRLVSSVMAIIVCLALLMGATFAWFTDGESSDGNVIKSGVLNVTASWEKGTVDPANANWKAFKDSAIFDHDNWEPGYAEARHIRLANEGSLAFKYQVSIVPNGTVSELADVIDVYYVNPAVQVSNRAQLGSEYLVGTLADLIAENDGAAHGVLLPEGVVANNANEVIGSTTATIVLKMQESAGDKYQNKSIGTDFSIKVIATQYAYEEDDLGLDFDAGLDFSASGLSVELADGSTALYYSEESGFAGRVRLSAAPEVLPSNYVIPEEINDLGGALAGATIETLTLPTNLAYAYKSLQGANITTAVVKEGATVIPDRTFYKAKVQSVVIPSTVTKIEVNAFAQAQISELVIPASVVTTEETAFQHMVGLTKVTFEGNTAIQGRAFRGCADLREVYLNGEDVTFVKSTLGGYNADWFCNSESNNSKTSTIDFYVKNETVAKRVRTAMGADKEYVRVFINGVLYEG